MIGSFLDEARKVAGDLASLEVNTVLKDGMTARKMPALPHALLDIAEAYADFLGEVGIDWHELWPETAGPIRPERWRPAFGPRGGTYFTGELRNGLDLFHRLRSVAAGVLDRRRAADGGIEAGRLSGAERVILMRICRNADQLKELLGRLSGSRGWAPFLGRTRLEVVAAMRAGRVPLAATDDLVLVRKIWDLGNEVIEVQTVVQLDGDIITRVRPGLGEAERAVLMALHQAALGTGLRHWGMLFALVVDLASGLAGRRPPWKAGLLG